MNTYVAWMFELEVKEGRGEEFHQLMNQMVDATEANEAGTLIYEYNFSPDGRTLHLYERYANSGAAMIHIRTFASTWAVRFFDVLEPKRFTLFGSPSDEVIAALSPGGIQVFRQDAGFSRF